MSRNPDRPERIDLGNPTNAGGSPARSPRTPCPPVHRGDHAAAGAEKTHWRIIWLLDQGQHVPAMAVPKGIDLIRLPALSPELQPAKRLWSLLDESVANRTVADLDELEAVLIERR